MSQVPYSVLHSATQLMLTRRNKYEIGTACLPLHSLLWWETRPKRRFSRYCIVEGFSTVGVALSHYFTLFESVFQGPLPQPPLSSFDYQRQRNLKRLLNTRSSELETTLEFFVFLFAEWHIEFFPFSCSVLLKKISGSTWYLGDIFIATYINLLLLLWTVEKDIWFNMVSW